MPPFLTGAIFDKEGKWHKIPHGQAFMLLCQSDLIQRIHNMYSIIVQREISQQGKGKKISVSRLSGIET